MIFSTSRYAGGIRGQMADRHSSNYTTYVFRKMPMRPTDIKYYQYVFRDSDRLDQLALRLLGDESRWWEIMDINPGIHDPMHIAPGTVLRIPNE